MKTYSLCMYFLIMLLIINISIGGTKMDSPDLDPNIHHYLGIELNMQVWDLINKNDRDQSDNNRMIAFAMGSLYHWQNSPHFTPVNAQRGEWLISRVFALLNSPERALEHAHKCWKITEEQDLKGFDLAYSYEALARAYALNGDLDNFRKYYGLAKEEGEKLDDEEDRRLFLEDLNSEPWNGHLSE